MGWKAVLCIVTLVAVMLHQISGKPISDKRGPPSPDPVEAGSKRDEDMGTGLEYDGYLRQVVEVLESDEEFRKKLETANISDIKSGKIALHLELVNHSIRNRLDEIKRMEIRRLQELALARMKSMSGVGVNRMDIPSHLDLKNPHSFEMKDLEQLIKKTTMDLDEVDKKRREEFKTYEMEKEFEYQEKIKAMPEEERKKEEEKHKELQEKHKQHEKINHPGSKDQFEEVWEKEDHLDDQDFDPKTFFMMHDLNGDRMWDIQEVEAVLQRELDKIYDARNSPEEDDPNERYEEMNRMREHVFSEIDTKKDFMITMDEFLDYTGKAGENQKFKEDEGWETLDEQQQFTDEEFEEYMRKHHPDRVPSPDSLKFEPEGQIHQQGTQQGHQQGMPQQGLQQQGMPQQGMQQQGMHQGVPQQGMNQQGVPQQGMNQQGVPQQGVPQQGVPQQAQQGFQQAPVQQPGQPVPPQQQQVQGQGQGQGQPVQNQPPVM